MKFRLAKISDIGNLADIHLECSKKQKGGFMYKLGISFFRVYYKILLNEINSIIVIAQDENGILCGFTSGTIAAEEHLAALKRNLFRLAFAIVPAIIISPSILKDLIKRYRFVTLKEESDQYGITNGPRIEYWAWTSDNKNNMSILLFKSWLKVIFSFGVKSVKGEIDMENKNMLMIHKILGANFIREFNLKDGRKRIIIEYNNETNKLEI